MKLLLTFALLISSFATFALELNKIYTTPEGGRYSCHTEGKWCPDGKTADDINHHINFSRFSKITEMVKRKNLDPNFTYVGQPLIYRMMHGNVVNPGDLRLFKLLLKKGANPSRKTNYGSSSGYSVPIMNASRMDYIKALIKYGATIHDEGSEGNILTPSIGGCRLTPLFKKVFKMYKPKKVIEYFKKTSGKSNMCHTLNEVYNMANNPLGISAPECQMMLDYVSDQTGGVVKLDNCH